jgi:spermidine synthase
VKYEVLLASAVPADDPGDYQTISMSFSIDIREKDGLRTLHFETERVQGAMRLARPWELVLEYTREMMACLLLRDENIFPRRILLIGLGAGSQAKFLYRHCPLAQLTVVEIEPRVVAMARQYFELPDDPARLNIVIGDGFEFMQNTDQTFDLILVDGFNEHAHPGELNTLPFYRACRARLNKQGLLAVNLIGLSNNSKGGFAHIESAFEHRAVLFPRCKSGNTIAFAATGEPIDVALDELHERTLVLEARTGLALLSIFRMDDALRGEGGRLRI